MNKEKCAAIIADIERENANDKSENSFELRKKLGLPLNISTDEVFIELGKSYNLPESADQYTILLAMLCEVRDMTNEVQADLDKTSKEISMFGKIAAKLFGLKRLI